MEFERTLVDRSRALDVEFSGANVRAPSKVRRFVDR